MCVCECMCVKNPLARYGAHAIRQATYKNCFNEGRFMVHPEIQFSEQINYSTYLVINYCFDLNFILHE